MCGWAETGFLSCPKAFVIAEKPSVAADLAKALGRFERKDDAFENEQYVISSAVGHLVELALPPDLDKKRGKWTFANLPGHSRRSSISSPSRRTRSASRCSSA